MVYNIIKTIKAWWAICRNAKYRIIQDSDIEKNWQCSSNSKDTHDKVLSGKDSVQYMLYKNHIAY